MGQLIKRTVSKQFGISRKLVAHVTVSAVRSLAQCSLCVFIGYYHVPASWCQVPAVLTPVNPIIRQSVAVITLFPGRVQSIVMTMSVCLFVRLSARTTGKTHGRISPNFCACCLYMAVARSSSGGVAICYALPGRWMTSCFHITARRVYSQAAIRYDKHNSRDFDQILLNDKNQQIIVSCALGAKLAIYECFTCSSEAPSQYCTRLKG